MDFAIFKPGYDKIALAIRFTGTVIGPDGAMRRVGKHQRFDFRGDVRAERPLLEDYESDANGKEEKTSHAPRTSWTPSTR